MAEGRPLPSNLEEEVASGGVRVTPGTSSWSTRLPTRRRAPGWPRRSPEEGYKVNHGPSPLRHWCKVIPMVRAWLGPLQKPESVLRALHRAPGQVCQPGQPCSSQHWNPGKKNTRGPEGSRLVQRGPKAHALDSCPPLRPTGSWFTAFI